MSKIEIESDSLAALAQTLNQAANILNQAIASGGPFKQANIEPSGTIERKKRGRPKKDIPANIKIVRGRKVFEVPTESLVPEGNIEIVSVEEEMLSVINEPDKIIQHKPVSSHIIAARRVTNTGMSADQNTIEVKKRPGEIKFIDVSNVGDRISADKYPEPTDRRNPAKKISFVCDRCRNSFEMYPSEIPQAFIKEKIPTGGEDKPRIYCDGCAGMGK